MSIGIAGRSAVSQACVYELVEDPLIEGAYCYVIRESRIFGDKNSPKRGKVRDIYDLGSELLIYHTDRISSFDAVLRDLVPYKGVYLAFLSSYWFRLSSGVFPNHLIEQVNERTLRVVKAQRIDIEWVARGYLYGSAWRAYKAGVKEISGVKLPSGLQLAEELPWPILTPTTKNEVGHDEEISRDEALRRGMVTRDEWIELEEASIKLYEFYRKEAKSRGVIVADVKLEFGRYDGGLIQIDEPATHDSARLWLEKYYAPGRLQEAYCLDKEFLRACLRAMGYNGEGDPPRLSRAIIGQIALRVKGAYEVLAGIRSPQDLMLLSVEEVLGGPSNG
jgi:phosphoribosylaminoimidazole-succinocarboxamide synthase